MAAAATNDRGWDRLAPLGVPVVPLVRMMADPGELGAGGGSASPATISDSSEGSVPATGLESEVQATKRPFGAPTPATTSLNSSS